ncbi:MAG TPA: dipeptide epimerase, partial [Caulobacter sp.]|nr:dipeptide epimerase [Caulobacter sp.]
MSLSVSARAVHHPLKAPFRISRGVKTAAEVVVVEVRSGDHIGRGESVPYARYGETPEQVVALL